MHVDAVLFVIFLSPRVVFAMLAGTFTHMIVTGAL